MSTENTHEGAARITAYLHTCRAERRSVFFIGVGGVMMSSLALLTRREGLITAGSDRTRTAVTDSLVAGGVTVFFDHDATHLPADCGLVVYTVAISPDNPEYVAARARGIPCVSRADYLGALMTGYRHRVGVAGMHGKSTCTSMCAQILLDAAARDEEIDPTILSGAVYAPMGGAYRLGESREHFLFEACEYMDSFLDFNPTVAVLLGAEPEHLDYFKDMEQICESFARFASLTGEGGVTVVNADNAAILESAHRAEHRGKTGRLVTFSASGDESADVYAQNVRIEAGLPVFELTVHGIFWGEVHLAVPGRHQVINALAAAAAMEVCGIPRADILSGLAHFCGAGRRMEKRGTVSGATVYDDYGHHPSEVRATLRGARDLCRAACPTGRLLCVFQPHTYSRTALLYDQFLTAFEAADVTLLLDIYAAREVNTFGVSSAQLAADLNTASAKSDAASAKSDAAAVKADAGAVKAAASGEAPAIPTAIYCPTPQDAADRVRALARPGDSIVIMGAGDVIGVTALLCPAGNE